MARFVLAPHPSITRIADPRCRVRFGERIYPVTAVLVGKPGEIAGFDADRFVYRLDSRGD